ncbi:MAG: hypothetical protein RIT43_480 [Bacteroidota bacterium]|jgi:hypothetical protein
METKEHVFKEHEENVELASKIDFYKVEILNLKTILSDFSKEIQMKNQLLELEHLENQMDIQENHANTISHAIRNDEKRIDGLFETNDKTPPPSVVQNHQKLKDLISSFERNFRELRREIGNFTSKVS